MTFLTVRAAQITPSSISNARARQMRLDAKGAVPEGGAENQLDKNSNRGPCTAKAALQDDPRLRQAAEGPFCHQGLK